MKDKIVDYLLKYKSIIIKVLLGIIALCLVLTVGYVLLFSTNYYRFKDIYYSSNKLSKEFDDFKIAFISDIHLKNNDDISRLSKMVEELNEKDCQMVIIGGDLYEKKIFENDEVKKILKSIHVGYGKFAVFGDEDKETSTLTNIYNDGGFEVLKNNTRPIYYKSQKFTLYGMKIEGKAKIIDDKGFRLTVAHLPNSFDNYKSKTDLQLSGHSGGGYIYLPLIGSTIKDTYTQNYNHGIYHDNTSTLIISNGFSTTSSHKYKYLAPNEIQIIHLSSTKAS